MLKLRMDNLTRHGIDAVRNGNTGAGRGLLEEAVKDDSHNALAWHWLASIEPNEAKKQDYLEHVLEIDPKNSFALRDLAELNRHRGMPVTTPSVATFTRPTSTTEEPTAKAGEAESSSSPAMTSRPSAGTTKPAGSAHDAVTRLSSITGGQRPAGSASLTGAPPAAAATGLSSPLPAGSGVSEAASTGIPGRGTPAVAGSVPHPAGPAQAVSTGGSTTALPAMSRTFSANDTTAVQSTPSAPSAAITSTSAPQPATTSALTGAAVGAAAGLAAGTATGLGAGGSTGSRATADRNTAGSAGGRTGVAGSPTSAEGEAMPGAPTGIMGTRPCSRLPLTPPLTADDVLGIVRRHRERRRAAATSAPPRLLLLAIVALLLVGLLAGMVARRAAVARTGGPQVRTAEPAVDRIAAQPATHPVHTGSGDFTIPGTGYLKSPGGAAGPNGSVVPLSPEASAGSQAPVCALPQGSAVLLLDSRTAADGSRTFQVQHRECTGWVSEGSLSSAPIGPGPVIQDVRSGWRPGK